MVGNARTFMPARRSILLRRIRCDERGVVADGEEGDGFVGVLEEMVVPRDEPAVRGRPYVCALAAPEIDDRRECIALREGVAGQEEGLVKAGDGRARAIVLARGEAGIRDADAGWLANLAV